LVGTAKAKRMVIGGELESAGDLLAWGFLDETVPQSQLSARASEMAAYYSSRPAMAAQMIKRSFNALQDAGNASIMHMDGDQFTLATESEDYEHQRAAFLAKTSQK
jgi:enoyl-CoA hydratase/carnithine racemase